MKTKFNFDAVIRNLERTKKDVPRILANKTRNYFVEHFDKQEFAEQKWPEPKRKEKYKKGKSTRMRSATLVQSGKLRRAVVNSIQKATWDSIVLSVRDVPYAAVHNEGLRAGRGKGFLMPKRRFVGDSAGLRRMQLNTIKEATDKIWQV